MHLKNMSKFHKSPNCPLSNDLLAFQTGKIAMREKERITVHLRFCEFCAAEVDFYAHYPQPEETVENAEIPQPLYELAEALLSNKHKDHSLLKRLFNKTVDDSGFTDF
jgi:hypothetical protein